MYGPNATLAGPSVKGKALADIEGAVDETVAVEIA